MREHDGAAADSLRRSPFPWFYSVFFMVMIIHRAMRDIERCRRKYGDAWKQYEKEVPYLFIPVSHCSLPLYQVPANMAQYVI